MEWINVKDKIPDCFAGKFKVKTEKKEEKECFFYSDKMIWISFYGKKPTYWWNSKRPYEPLYNVEYWASKYNTYELDSYYPINHSCVYNIHFENAIMKLSIDK